MANTAYIALNRPPELAKSGFDNACYRDFSELDGAKLLVLDGSKIDFWCVMKEFVTNPELVINPLCWKYAKALTNLSNLSLEQFDEVFLSTSVLCYALPSKQSLRITVRHHNCEWKYLSALASVEPNVFRRVILMWTSYINKKMLTRIIKHKPYAHVFYTNSDLVETRSSLSYRATAGHLRVLPLKYNRYASKVLAYIKTVVFFGGRHGPNAEAARWIIDDVAPHVPWCTFKIYMQGLSQDASKNIQVEEWIDNPFELNDGSTLYLLPAFSGSGVKIKILEALEHGAPLAANYSALEGLRSKIECCLPDNKIEAAGAIIDFLRSKKHE